MEVLTIESGAFKAIEGMVSQILNVVTSQSAELKQLKENRLMDLSEVMGYTGFGKTWLMERKADIGYVQIGSSPLRFYKENVDAYLGKHFIQRKSK